MFTMADSSRNVDSTTRVSLQYDSSKTEFKIVAGVCCVFNFCESTTVLILGNKSTCDMVQDTYFPTADSNISNEADGLFKGLTSVKIVPENLANDSILSGAKENEILDIDIKKLSKPLLSRFLFENHPDSLIVLRCVTSNYDDAAYQIFIQKVLRSSVTTR